MADVLKSEQEVKDVLTSLRDAAQKRSWYVCKAGCRDFWIGLSPGILETEVSRLQLAIAFLQSQTLVDPDLI
jgi:hypothetical protein